MEEIYNRLKRHWNYVYWCREKSTSKDRAWWNGYFEAIGFILKLLRKARKETK